MPRCISNDLLDHIVSFTLTSLGLLKVHNLAGNSCKIFTLSSGLHRLALLEHSCWAFSATCLFEMNDGHLQLGTYKYYLLGYFENFVKILVDCKFVENDQQINRSNSNWRGLRVIFKLIF